MDASTDFQEVFKRLKQNFTSIPGTTLTADDGANFSLNMPYAAQYKREIFLGAVQIKKNYVSYYLMPVYMFPDLLDGISPGLQKRMQGKSCFNFKKVEEGLFAELADLTVKSLARARQEGFLP